MDAAIVFLVRAVSFGSEAVIAIFRWIGQPELVEDPETIVLYGAFAEASRSPMDFRLSIGHETKTS